MEDYEARVLRDYYSEGSEEYIAAANRIDSGEPLAYVVGEQYFYGERYKLNSDCLIPRPDTECVVEELLRHLKHGSRFADICCGSGCIAISALCHSEMTSALGVDISKRALEAANDNALLNGVADRYRTMCSDLFASDFELGSSFDVVVSNPPYIRSDVVPTLGESVLHEPVCALDGGEDGLKFYRVLLDLFDKIVSPGGAMILEIGYDQADQLRSLCDGRSLCCKIKKDYGGNDRVCTVTRPEHIKI